MSKSKAAVLLKAAEKAQKAGNKVAATERRLAKLVKDCERAEAEYMTLVVETFATRPPASSPIGASQEGQPANPA
jgi:hypothetical protein